MKPDNRSGRTIMLLFGIAVYAVYLISLLFLVVFQLKPGLPGMEIPTGNPWQAILIDCGLISLFAIPHSVMARPFFKERFRRLLPEPVERSVYVLVASVALCLATFLWQDLRGGIWKIEDPLARAIVIGVFGAGVAIAIASTFAIDHFELFGLRQVWLNFRQAPAAPTSKFVTPFLYRLVRHPLMFGMLLLLWSIPEMSVGHLIFSAGMSLYIFVGIFYEERDLKRTFGESYQTYSRKVPMLLPWKGKN